MPPRPDPVRDFKRLQEKHIALGCALAASADNPGQLVDLVVRHRVFQNPRLSYREAMEDVFAADPELKKLYAEW